MEISDTVRIPRTQVKQCERGFVSHTCKAIRGTGYDTLENPSTALIRGSLSRAATSCISDVPGFAKHAVTPASANFFISRSAPFITALLPIAIIFI